MHPDTDRTTWNRWYAAPLAMFVMWLVAPGSLFAQPTITKSFNPASVQIGQRSTLTFTINNPAGSAISAVAFTDNFHHSGESAALCRGRQYRRDHAHELRRRI